MTEKTVYLVGRGQVVPGNGHTCLGEMGLEGQRRKTKLCWLLSPLVPILKTDGTNVALWEPAHRIPGPGRNLKSDGASLHKSRFQGPRKFFPQTEPGFHPAVSPCLII